MLAALHFITEQVVGDSYLELLTLAVVVSAFVTAYRHVECHKTGCHRLGRFRHGHLKLCALHHPLVPNDGRITDEHIKTVTREVADRAAAGRASTPAP